MRNSEVKPLLIVQRHGGSSALVPDANRGNLSGRRPGYITTGVIVRGRVTVCWLNANGAPGRSEQVAVHRLIPIGGFYSPPPERPIKVVAQPLAPDRAQMAWVFPGIRKPVEKRKRRSPRRRVKPEQLPLPL